MPSSAKPELLGLVLDHIHLVNGVTTNDNGTVCVELSQWSCSQSTEGFEIYNLHLAEGVEFESPTYDVDEDDDGILCTASVSCTATLPAEFAGEIDIALQEYKNECIAKLFANREPGNHCDAARRAI